ncbi:MAG: DsbA family protein [Actinomycetota bacterium]|nr:DsbA family protein [Actinomycetota bacterium]
MSQHVPPQNRTERTATIRADRARAERNKRIAITAAIVAVLAVIVTAGVWFSNGSSNPATGSTGAPAVSVGNDSLIVGGNRNAKVKVVVYEDLLCPYCRQFETSSRDFLHADAAAGKVQVEYRPFQLLPDPYSKRALNAWGVVLKKGTPAQALKFHDLLYDNQPYESASNKPGVAALQALAKQAGVRQSVVDTLGTPFPGFYAAVQKAARGANVQGTPTVLVNGKPLSGATIDDMVIRLEKQIAAS